MSKPELTREAYDAFIEAMQGFLNELPVITRYAGAVSDKRDKGDGRAIDLKHRAQRIVSEVNNYVRHWPWLELKPGPYVGEKVRTLTGADHAHLALALHRARGHLGDALVGIGRYRRMTKANVQMPIHRLILHIDKFRSDAELRLFVFEPDRDLGFPHYSWSDAKKLADKYGVEVTNE